MTTQYEGVTAALYNSERALAHPMNQVTHATWLKALGDIRGKTILDLACGGGHSSRLLAERGASVIGVDISKEMIRHAQNFESIRPLGIKYQVGDAATLELGREFDIVTPSFLFHYAASRELLLQYMETVCRHVRPGGRTVALNAWKPIVPRSINNGHWSELVCPEDGLIEGARLRLHILDDKGSEVCPIEYFHWEPSTYARLLQKCGFEHVQWIHHKVPGELRTRYPNWREIETVNSSCVIAATKAT